MKKNATEQEINNVQQVLKDHGLGVHLSKGTDTTIIGIIGD